MRYIVLLLCLLTFSCGFKQWNNRGINKGWLKSDTIIDSVFIKEYHKDTIFNHYHTRDTVFLKQDKLLVKYFYNNSDSTVYLSGKCESDTIRVEKVINNIQGSQGLNWPYLAVIAGLIFLLWLLKR